MSKDWILTDEKCIYRHATIDGKWKVHVAATDPDTGKMTHRRRTLKSATLLDAIRKREELRAKIQTPTTLKSDSIPRRSIAYFAAQWAGEMVECGRWGPGTAQTNREILTKHIIPQIGHIDVGRLDRDHIRRWIDSQEKKRYDKAKSPDKTKLVPYAHSTLRRHWKIMCHLVRGLYLEGYVDRRMVDWMREIQGPTAPSVKPRRERDTLTLEELRELVAAAKTRAQTRYAEIVTLAYTGMRGGELYGLEWRHVHFDDDPKKQHILVEQSYSSKSGLTDTKTGKSRKVPMIPVVAEAIREHRKQLVAKGNIGAIADGILFPSNVGTRRTASCIQKPMQQVADSCGIDVKMGSQVTRRTLITLLKNAGSSLSLIMSIVGHERVETNDGYTAPRTEDTSVPVIQLFGG